MTPNTGVVKIESSSCVLYGWGERIRIHVPLQLYPIDATFFELVHCITNV